MLALREREPERAGPISRLASWLAIRRLRAEMRPFRRRSGRSAASPLFHALVQVNFNRLG